MNASANILRNIVSSEEKYSGHIVDLRVDIVKFPSGAEKAREVVLHKSAVAILPVNEHGEIILVKQYRHAIDEDIYEIPAGLVEDGEEACETAVRELREETGYRPGHIEEIAEFYSSPGFCTEKISVYYATDLISAKLPADEDEYIKVHAFTPKELQKMIAEKNIKDGKTLMAFYWYAAERLQK